MITDEMTSYQRWQMEKYGNILPEFKPMFPNMHEENEPEPTPWKDYLTDQA